MDIQILETFSIAIKNSRKVHQHTDVITLRQGEIINPIKVQEMVAGSKLSLVGSKLSPEQVKNVLLAHIDKTLDGKAVLIKLLTEIHDGRADANYQSLILEGKIAEIVDGKKVNDKKSKSESIIADVSDVAA